MVNARATYHYSPLLQTARGREEDPEGQTAVCDRCMPRWGALEEAVRMRLPKGTRQLAVC
jgi:hypothetical protein